MVLTTHPQSLLYRASSTLPESTRYVHRVFARWMGETGARRGRSCSSGATSLAVPLRVWERVTRPSSRGGGGRATGGSTAATALATSGREIPSSRECAVRARGGDVGGDRNEGRGCGEGARNMSPHPREGAEGEIRLGLGARAGAPGSGSREKTGCHDKAGADVAEEGGNAIPRGRW